MPRAPSHWAPRWARRQCYSCARVFERHSGKSNCPLCYDVFCQQCMGDPVQVEEFGRPLPVCDTCSLLARLFPLISDGLADSSAGQMLQPLQRAFIVLQGELPPHPQAPGTPASAPQFERAPSDSDSQRGGSGGGKAASEGEAKGIRGFFRRVKSDKRSSSDAQRGEGMPRSTGVGVAAAGIAVRPLPPVGQVKVAKQYDYSSSLPVTLCSFRPLNPDTTLCIGAHELPLGRIEAIECTESGHVRIVAEDRRFVELVIGMTELPDGAALPDHSDVAFSIEPKPGASFGAALNGLLEHCRTHAAFSRVFAPDFVGLTM